MSKIYFQLQCLHLSFQCCNRVDKREIDVINVSIKPIKQLISPAYCGRLRYYPPDLSAISNIAYISSFEALMILPSSACALPSSSLYTPYSSGCMTRIFLFEGKECESQSSVGSNHSPNCRSTLLKIVYLIHKVIDHGFDPILSMVYKCFNYYYYIIEST